MLYNTYETKLLMYSNVLTSACLLMGEELVSVCVFVCGACCAPPPRRRQRACFPTKTRPNHARSPGHDMHRGCLPPCGSAPRGSAGSVQSRRLQDGAQHVTLAPERLHLLDELLVLELELPRALLEVTHVVLAPLARLLR